MRNRGYLGIPGLIFLSLIGDFALNQGRATLFLIREVISLQEYLQFWR